MGKKNVVAETGAGQHGVATASAAAKLGLGCNVYMGAVDVKRQHPNVFTMQMFGANVVSVESGNKGLADAVDEALGFWIKSLKDTHYLLGSVVGPAPFPAIVREFQSVIGREAKQQVQELGQDVAAVIAAVGGGSNAMGIFSGFLDDEKIQLIGVEGGGIGDKYGEHAKRLAPNSGAKTGIHHGYKSKFLLDSNGDVLPTHSISAGLMEKIDNAEKFSRRIIVEHMVKDMMEINCSVLGDCDDYQTSVCEEPISKGDFLSYEEKYGGGSKAGMQSSEKRIPADIPETMSDEIRKMAGETFRVLSCHGVSRVDVMVDRSDNKIYVNEINTIPGSLSFYLWEETGITFMQLMDKLVELALRRKRETDRKTFTYDANIFAMGGGVKGGVKGAKGSKFGHR